MREVGKCPCAVSARLLLYVLPLTDLILEYVDFWVVFRPRFASGRGLSWSSSDQWERILSAIGDAVGGEVEMDGERADGRAREV